MEVSSNAANVIPGEARISVELRDLSAAKLEGLTEKIRGRVAATGKEARTDIRIKGDGAQ